MTHDRGDDPPATYPQNEGTPYPQNEGTPCPQNEGWGALNTRAHSGESGERSGDAREVRDPAGRTPPAGSGELTPAEPDPGHKPPWSRNVARMPTRPRPPAPRASDLADHWMDNWAATNPALSECADCRTPFRPATPGQALCLPCLRGVDPDNPPRPELIPIGSKLIDGHGGQARYESGCRCPACALWRGTWGKRANIRRRKR